MADEIEKKYLVAKSIDLEGLIRPFKTTDIVQAYLEVGETERRVRSKGDKFFYTVKETAQGTNGLVRSENESEISETEFRKGLSQHVGDIILKTRTKMPLQGNLYAELDIYKGALKGLVTVEVEFPNVKMANKFEQPGWFGEDVTADKRYKNQSLAMNGLPKEKESEIER